MLCTFFYITHNKVAQWNAFEPSVATMMLWKTNAGYKKLFIPSLRRIITETFRLAKTSAISSTS